MQSELAWQSLQVTGENLESQTVLMHTGLMQHGTVGHVSCRLYGVHTHAYDNRPQRVLSNEQFFPC